MWDRAETLQRLFDRLEERRETPALIAFSRDGAEEWSSSRLGEEAGRVARGLQQSGIQPGEPVALWAGPGPEWVAVCLGIMASGAVVLPLDTQFSDETLRHVLDDSGARLIFTEKKKKKRLDEISFSHAPDIALLDVAKEDPDGWQRYRADEQAAPTGNPDDTVALFYTSGTTGPPKGVPLSHRNLAGQIGILEKADFLREDDRVLLPLPLHHVYPFVMGILAPLGLGLPVILPQGLTGPQILRAIKEGHATLIIGVPRLYRALLAGIEAQLRSAGGWAVTVFRALLSAASFLQRRLHVSVGGVLFRPIRNRFGPDLRLLASGGAPLQPELGQRLEALGWSVAVGYGLTETSPLITIRLPGGGPMASVGWPVPGAEVRLDPKALPDGGKGSGKDAGELLVRGPNVFRGYHRMPEKTQQSFTDGWFRTGDLARVDKRGRLYLLGRASTLIVTGGGENVQPDEVEEAYQQHPAIAEIGVLQYEGALVGVAVPELRRVRESGEPPEKLVHTAVGEVSRRLASYQRLNEVAVTRTALERTRLGKLRRHLLAERFEKARRETVEAPSGEPMDMHDMTPDDRELLEHPTAREVWGWLADRYSDKPLTPDSSPQLDLGVDSMEWVNLTMELGQRTGVELGDEDIAGAETVRELLAAAIDAAGGEKAGEGAAEALRNPERVLDERQLRWLQRPGPIRRLLFAVLAGINTTVVRLLFRLDVRGLDKLEPGNPYLLAPNHLSYIDPFVLASALGYRRLRGIYWAGFTGAAFANPLQRLGSRIAQVVPIDPEKGIITSLALGAAVLNSGHILVWFPEGGRSRDGRMQPLKPGTGLLLEKHPVPVVPIAIRGSYELMPSGRRLPRPGRVRIEFGTPVDAQTLAREGEGGEKRERILDGLERRLRALVEKKSAD